MGAGGSCGLVCCWWSQAQEKVTGESLLLVSISPVSESWILCTPPTQHMWGLQVPFLSVITFCSYYYFVFNIPFLCKIHYSGFCA